MTGQCNNVTVSSGLCGKGLDNCVPFVYRGIENLYGGIELLIEGVKITQDGYFATNDISTYGDITKPTADSTNYKLLSYDFPRNSNRPVEGYIDKLGVDKNAPYALLPETSNGSSDTAYCDIFTGGNTIIKASECRILCSFYTNGLFGCDISKDCDSMSNISGRLVYAKEAV